MLLEDLTREVINSFYKVYNTLGYGFLEKVYEKALYIELSKKGFSCVCQKTIEVFYEGNTVGNYFADIMIEDLLIIEIKAAETICEEHEYQLINYLKASKIEIGLLLNFGRSPQVKRKIYSNNKKLF